MDEDGAMNFANTNNDRIDEPYSIKKEFEIRIKLEPHECVVCSSRTYDSYDIFVTTTVASGTTLHDFLCKLTNVTLSNSNKNPKQICKACLDLVNVLEEAEIEYTKLKQTFEAIISKNPLFDTPTAQPINLATIKNEFDTCENSPPGLDSEDEPLAVARKRRQISRDSKRKKKSTSIAHKKKSRQKENDSWSCETCGVKGIGGTVAETAHKLSAHTLEDITIEQSNVKTEESNDGSQSTQCTNGADSDDEGSLKLELVVDDDTSSNYFPENALSERRARTSARGGRPRGRPRRGAPAHSPRTPRTPRTPRPKKVMHQCDVCLARYSSLERLRAHREKHESKPPYICEVCGAHYKHKRACDVHVALHRGISDWKCHDCDKLFPSKGALHRHNNIHTGKPNYQCDLCGKSFIHTSSFKMHKLTHSGVKPHACDVCGLALMTRSHLKRHKRVHSGEKRHECPVCGKRFSERYNLAAHSKSHEGGGAPLAPPAPRRPMFRCAFCPERFERRYMLERHCGAAHGRPLERAPPTPRNTMSKLLKAQARRPPTQPPHEPPAILHTLLTDTKIEVKEDGSPPPRGASPPAAPDTPAPATAPAPAPAPARPKHGTGAGASWAGAFCAEFALRPDYPQ